jgi:quinol monooxygenase YgiN
MVRVVAVNYVRADAVDEYLKLSKEIVEKTNALDKGCIAYELHRDLSDPLRFAMIESWDEQASLDAHMASAHFRELIPQLGACGDPTKEGGIALYSKVEF